jgi:hypothetical protein
VTFEYDKIVVGGDLRALLFAYLNSLPIFFAQQQKPFEYEFFKPNLDLSFCGIPSETTKLNCNSKVKKIGIKKVILWERLYFLLSLRGLVPLSNLCTTIRHNDGVISCHNEYSKIAEFEFNKCFYFDSPNCFNFAVDNLLDESNYLCYDEIAFNKGGKHDIEFINGDDEFVSEIYFHITSRLLGNNSIRDAVALSTLTESQLQDFNFSETMASFKIGSLLKENGVRGQFNGYSKNGVPMYYNFKTTSIKRTLRKLPGNIKSKYRNIKIVDDNLNKIIKNCLQIEDSFLTKLKHDAFKRNHTNSEL